MIAYRGRKYYLDVVETKPSHAVSIIDTDCEVDFVQPLDYKEPEKQLPSVSPSSDKELTEGCDCDSSLSSVGSLEYAFKYFL